MTARDKLEVLDLIGSILDNVLYFRSEGESFTEVSLGEALAKLREEIQMQADYEVSSEDIGLKENKI